MITALRFLDQAGLVPAYPKRINSMVVTPRQIERSVDVPSVLSRVPLLGLLDAGHIGKLAETARVKEFPAGIAIVNEGEPGESLYVVVAGILEVSLRGEDATARTVARLEPGDVFGEMSLLTGQPRSATVTAASPVILVEIDKAHLEPIFATEPALIGQLTELEAARLISNRDAARLSPAEHAEIGAVGIAAFLRGRILRFFGQAAR
jgi:CRP-like cAMP-binding protein